MREAIEVQKSKISLLALVKRTNGGVVVVTGAKKEKKVRWEREAFSALVSDVTHVN